MKTVLLVKAILSNNKIFKNISKIFMFAYPVYLFFSLELMNPGVISTVINIFGISFPNPFTRSPYTELMRNIPAVIFSVIGIYLLILMIFSFVDNIFASCTITSIFLYACYIVNYYRKLLTGWVFSPADLKFVGRAGDILTFAEIKIDKYVIYPAILIIVGLIIVFFVSKGIKLDLRKRMLIFSSTLMVTLFVFFTLPMQKFIFSRTGVQYNAFKTSANQLYRDYGVFLGFYIASLSDEIDNIFDEAYYASADMGTADSVKSNLSPVDKGNNSTPEAPEDEGNEPLQRIGAANFKDRYNYDFMKNVIDKMLDRANRSKKTISPVEKPNIIVIMSEAFTDPTDWDNISFNNDPAPVLHELQKTATTGKMVSPAFGGATCNPEFEFLTGNAMYFVNVGDTPFNSPETYIPKNDTRALPWIFKNNGYKTIAVHTYHDDVYYRRDIYPHLGFDKYIYDKDMPDADLKGGYISDEYFTDKIIESIENTDEPLFLYGISMENHYSYHPNKFPDLDIICESDNLDDYQEDCTNAYLQGVYDADKQLGRLIEYLKTYEKPTILYFFGDHLPLLGGAAVDIYTALGYVKYGAMTEWDADEYYKMHTTPYALWANYDLPEHDWQDMSAYFIGPLLLDIAGLEKNVYFDYLLDMYQDFHGLVSSIYVHNDNRHYSNPLVKSKETLDNFYYLNYDYIFGNRYSAEIMAKMNKQN